MRPIVTYEGIDEALKNLRYINKNSLKSKLINTIIEQYHSRGGSVESIDEIDTDFLVKTLWDTGEDPVLIKSRRKNFNSIKSTVNSDLKNLYSGGLNKEGIIINQKNIFDMSDEAKSEMLESFSYGGNGNSQIPLDKITDVLSVINDFISNKESGIEANEKFEQLKELIKDISGKVGISIVSEDSNAGNVIYAKSTEATPVQKEPIDENVVIVQEEVPVDETDDKYEELELEDVPEEELDDSNEGEVDVALEPIDEADEPEDAALEELTELPEDEIEEELLEGDTEEVPEDEIEEIPEEEIVEAPIDEEIADDELEEIEVVDTPEQEEEAIEDEVEVIEEPLEEPVDEVDEIEDIPEEELEELPEDALEEELIDDTDEEPVEEIEDDEFEEVEVEDVPEEELEEEAPEDEVEVIEEPLDEPVDEVDEIEDIPEEEVEEFPEEDVEEEPVDEIEDDEFEEVEVEDVPDELEEEVPEDEVEVIEEPLEEALDEVDELEELPEEELEKLPDDEAEEEPIDDIEELPVDEVDIEEAPDELEEANEDDIEFVDEPLEERLDDVDALEDVPEEELEDIPGDEITEEPVDEPIIESDDLDEIPEDELEEVPEDEIAELLEDDDYSLEEILEDYDTTGYLSEEGKEQALILADRFDKMLSDTERYYNRYLLVPGGRFLIVNAPSKAENKTWRYIELPDFYFGKFPVTNNLFELFIEKTGYVTTAERIGYGNVYKGRYRYKIDEKSGRKILEWNSALNHEKVDGACWYQPHGPGSTVHGKRNYPVVQVTLEDAMAFAAWTGKRLPTEQEWEAAARTSSGLDYPWGKKPDKEKCNIEASAIGDTTPVEKYQKAANKYEIYDLLGNVLEWTASSESQEGNVLFIAKGGSWVSGENITLTSKFLLDPKSPSNIAGFRCITYK